MRQSEITYLADSIDHLTLRRDHRLDSNDFTQQLLPVVHAVNRLVSFDEDRFNQEHAFSADASHELRTPLAGIRLQTQIAMRTQEPEKQQTAHKNILKAIDRATRLVEQLLVTSRLTLEKKESDLKEINLQILGDQALSAVGTMAKEKALQLRFTDLTSNHAYRGSEEHFATLLDNLLRNAIYFSPSESLVTLEISASKENLIMRVADYGPGIPEADRAKVMYRFQKSVGGAKNGSGLGLAIVKRIVDMYEGTVELSDNCEHKHLRIDAPTNRGLKISVSLPAQGLVKQLG